MSGSFWKFGQDYSIESPVTKILNKAFIKINGSGDEEDKSNSDEEIHTVEKIDNVSMKSEDDNTKDSNKSEEEDEEEEEEQHEDEIDSLPANEEDYKDYEPNLDVLDDLLDDEELYTELMCSNFKLLIFLKYPKVLKKLIGYVTSENILNENFDEDIETDPLIDNDDTYGNVDGKKIEDLNQQVILVNQDESIDETTIECKVQEGYEEIDTNPKSDENSIASEETSITVPPESEEQLESRRARMAAEILSADIWPISSTIMEHLELLEELWSIMDHESPLSIVASTYFMKINERLLDMDVNGMLNFILSQKSSVDRFLQHIENPSLMDFLLKVISTDKPDSPTDIIKELKSQDLIPKLLDRLDLDQYSASIQSASGDFLKAFVTLSANSNNEIALGIGPNELTRQLVSPLMIEKLIQIMLKGGTSLSNGVGIVIELIRKNNSDYDFIQVMYTTIQTHPPNDRDPIHLIHLVKLFAKYMKDFEKLLTGIKLPELETPFGKIEPLGFERFKICELVAELLHCSNMALLNEPKGETVTKERDTIRSDILAKEGDSEDEIKTISDEEIIEKLQSVDLNTTDNANEEDETENTSLDVNENSTIEMDSTQEIDNEVYPDDIIDDSEITETELREKKLSGDELKITLRDTFIVRNIMKMFFKFEWNNFLHNVVFDIVQQIFNGPLKSGYNKFLLVDLLTDSHLTDNIIEGDDACIKYEEETGIRLGYMGHLTLIAEEVAKFVEYIDEMKVTFTESGISDALNKESWKTYMDTTLADVREKYNTVLGDFASQDDDTEELEGQILNINNGNSDDDIDNENYNDEDDEIDPNDDGQGAGLFKNKSHEESEFYNEEIEDIPRDNEHYLSTGDDFNTESFYKYNKDISTGSKDSSEDEEDEYTEYSDKNSKSYYEYVDPSGHKTTINLNHLEDGDGSNETNHDDDIKAVYQSQFQLGEQDDNSIKKSISSNEENDFIDYFPNEHASEEYDDDYMDPNDDGQSYAKPNHPLYTGSELLSSNIKLNEDDLQACEDEDSSSDDNDYSSDDDEEDDPNEETNEYSLYRTPSREDLTTQE